MSYSQTIELIARCIDTLGVAIIIFGVIVGAIQFFGSALKFELTDLLYRKLRGNIERATLLGIDFLVASDIIRTIAISPSFNSVGILGLIITIRIALSISISLEVDRPWLKDPDRKKTLDIQKK